MAEHPAAAHPGMPPHDGEARLAALEAVLLQRAGRGAKLGLDRVRRALEQLGGPHNRLAVAHVAGTNGKGSSCAMLEAIARAAGLSTGLSTSPHLERLSERIRLNGEEIDTPRLCQALEAALDPALPPLSFFEAVTAAALWVMDQARVDLAVVEVGLGGRLDASNVFAAPRVTAISSIAYDHTAILGNRLDVIAREKAAIARRGRPLVLGPLPPAATEAVAAYAAHAGVSEVWQVARSDAEADRNWRRHGHAPLLRARHGEALIISPPGGPALRCRPALLGDHQDDNAALAAGMALLLQEPRIDAAAVARGLAQARWPGRLERLARGGVTVWLDCAHNDHAVAALRRALLARPPPPDKRRALLFGAMGDKAWRPMLDALAPLADARLYAPPLPPNAGRRAVPGEALAAHLPGRAFDTPEAAMAAAFEELEPGDELLVAGSAYLVGAARAWLHGRARKLAVPL